MLLRGVDGRFLNCSIAIEEPLQYPFYHTHHESILPGIPDGITSLLVNVLAYWVVSLPYHCLDISGWRWLDKYRIQESEEAKQRNLVTTGQAVRSVAFQQFIQTSFGVAWYLLFPVPLPPTNHLHELGVLSSRIARNAFMILGEKHRWCAVFERYGQSIAYSMYWWILPTWKFFFALCVIFFLFSVFV